MTKTTEELKRNMLTALDVAKKITDRGVALTHSLAVFESSLEAYLERLRTDAEDLALPLHCTQKDLAAYQDAYESQKQLTHNACAAERESWYQIHELKRQVGELEIANANGCRVLMQLSDEANVLREANAAAGDQLRAANELVKQYRETNQRQRQSAGKLKNERDNFERTVRVRTSQRDGLDAQLQEARKQLQEARESQACTSAQSLPERPAGAELDTVTLRDPLMPAGKCTHPKSWRGYSTLLMGNICGKCGTPARNF